MHAQILGSQISRKSTDTSVLNKDTCTKARVLKSIYAQIIGSQIDIYAWILGSQIKIHEQINRVSNNHTCTNTSV